MMQYPPVPDTDLTAALILGNTCPRCLGHLDEGWECIKCGYDCYDLVRERMEKSS